jgi:hypothetical protein
VLEVKLFSTFGKTENRVKANLLILV